MDTTRIAVLHREIAQLRADRIMLQGYGCGEEAPMMLDLESMLDRRCDELSILLLRDHEYEAP